MIDLIGDIHGHADKLVELLNKLGYSKQHGVYSHPNRKVLFIGDYIDRGPRIRETLDIVRSMVENDHAIALMGNHEYNALCFHYLDVGGGHLRKHNIKHIVQHYETLKQFQNEQSAYNDYIEWFKSLPLYYESDSFRAVHACWDSTHIEYLRSVLPDNQLTKELIIESVDRSTKLYDAIEQTLKGKELLLPDGLSFKDADGSVRKNVRIKWWEDPSAMTYKSISVEPLENLPERNIVLQSLSSPEYYHTDEKKIFFGHYWLTGEPLPYRDNVCCIDYSVAKGGKLVAYRFKGEAALDAKNIVYV